MSTSPSVIRRFVEYYAGLDAQPPAALAALYHPDAERSFWSASGAVRHSALLYPSAGQRGAVPVHHRHAALRRPAVRRDLDHALVASAHCRRRNPGPAGLLGGGHRRGAGSPSARLLRRRGDDLRASSPAGLGGTRREAEGALMMTVLITGASSGSAPAWRNPSRRMAIWSSPAGAMRRAWQRSSSSAPTSAYACSI